jgi:selenide,water dikinase
VGPGDLQIIMSGLGRPYTAQVLVGTETGDDAGVYQIDAERALVVTADFITPVADEPYRFGAIAAANSLSDVFAMGGRPLTALALCCFPKELEPEVAREILAGGTDKVEEAGAQVIGGHTVRNPELLYGLSVTGVVHPGQILRNVGVRPGDALVLTKPLGTGLIINARRKGLGSDADFAAALESMTRLNRVAAEAALAVGAHAGTDITGFGLVGHALKMALGSKVSLVIDAAALPLLQGAAALARQGVTTGSTKPNRAAGAGHVRFVGEGGPELDQIVHDPQTSGGLLLAVAAERAGELLARLGEGGVTGAAIIGQAVAATDVAIEVRGQLHAVHTHP